MSIEGHLILTFGLLGLSICTVWLDPIRYGKKYCASPWILLFVGACFSGLSAGFLTLTAIAELGVFGTVTYFASRAETTRLHAMIFGACTVILGLALAMHRLPGFSNPVLVANIKFSADAASFTQYANFDKASVGLILLAFLCNRASTASDWQDVLRRTLPIAVATIVPVIAVAIAIGYVNLDPKLSWITPVFLATNLLFTCVAEEAFFRGTLQDRLARSLNDIRFGGLIAGLCSGILFGAVHFAGGTRYVILATLAGLGYAYAYAVVKRVEAPILVHFVFNAVHFVGFTYPHIL